MRLPEIGDGLNHLEAMRESFDDFLLSDETFWPLGRAQYPKLSLGHLLLSLDQIQVQTDAMTDDQVGRLHAVTEWWSQALEARPANLNKKALAESKQRLNLWRAYLTESPGPGSPSTYANEVAQRALPSRLMLELQPGSGWEELRSLIDQLDRQLRTRFRPGAFVWPDRLRQRYGQQTFWFLYGSLV